MTEFRFGTIIGMDFHATLRLLALCPLPPEMQKSLRRETWWATVLIDSGLPPYDGWEVGRIVTVAPGSAGIIVVEEGQLGT